MMTAYWTLAKHCIWSKLLLSTISTEIHKLTLMKVDNASIALATCLFNVGLASNNCLKTRNFTDSRR